MSVAAFMLAVLGAELLIIAVVLVAITIRLGRLPTTVHVMAMVVAVGALTVAAMLCWWPLPDMPAPSTIPTTYGPPPDGWGTR